MTSQTSGKFPVPDGWFAFGSFTDYGWLPLEFSADLDEGGLPLWERPLQNPLSQVTRVTVVGDSGRAFEGWDLFENGAELAVQDAGRTLKVLPRRPDSSETDW